MFLSGLLDTVFTRLDTIIIAKLYIISKSLGIIIFVTFFLLGGLYLVSHELVIMLFGEKWLQTVEGYLYGLVIATTLAVYLNIVFVSKEIKMPKWSYIKPILIQMLLTVAIVMLLEWLNTDMTYSLLLMFFLKGGEYLLLYIMANKLLNTDAYRYFMIEAKPALAKIRNKMRR